MAKLGAPKKTKGTGRPEGRPNKKSSVVRDQSVTIRASEGLVICIDLLVNDGQYKSRSDFLHDASQALIYKKQVRNDQDNKKYDLYKNKIV